MYRGERGKTRDGKRKKLMNQAVAFFVVALAFDLGLAAASFAATFFFSVVFAVTFFAAGFFETVAVVFFVAAAAFLGAAAGAFFVEVVAEAFFAAGAADFFVAAAAGFLVVVAFALAAVVGFLAAGLAAGLVAAVGFFTTPAGFVFSLVASDLLFLGASLTLPEGPFGNVKIPPFSPETMAALSWWRLVPLNSTWYFSSAYFLIACRLTPERS